MPMSPPPRALHCGARILDLSQPQVMGVLNVTPDSFSDGGLYYRNHRLDIDTLLPRAEAMLADGATLLDIGGESTRPGAAPVSSDEEMARVLPALEALVQRLDAVISIDTSNPALMREAAGRGASMINDIRALQRPGALQAVAETRLGVCLMHMQGEPGNMQQQPRYACVETEVRDFLQARVDACLAAGIAADRLVVDPGFGFGKTVEHNLRLLNRLPVLTALGLPVLVGLSRKSLIDKVLNRSVEQRLAAGLSLASMAVIRGAAIVRAHDVRETVDALRMVSAVLAERQYKA
jgi:dihydropteroate synthase